MSLFAHLRKMRHLLQVKTAATKYKLIHHQTTGATVDGTAPPLFLWLSVAQVLFWSQVYQVKSRNQLPLSIFIMQQYTTQADMQCWDRTTNYGSANQIQVLYLKEPQNVYVV